MMEEDIWVDRFKVMDAEENYHKTLARKVCILNFENNRGEITTNLRGVEWVHGLFLFPLVLGKI